MFRKGFVVLTVACALVAPVFADEASLELTFKKEARDGEKATFVARTQDRDGTTRAEARLEMSVKRGEGSSLTVETRRCEEPARTEASTTDVNDEVAKALAQANSAMRRADRELARAGRELDRAMRELDASLSSIGIRVEGERALAAEPRSVVELCGIDEHLVVASSASRREATVELSGRRVSCTLHEFRIREKGEERSVSVWVSADVNGTGLVALRVSGSDGTREMALEGFVETKK